MNIKEKFNNAKAWTAEKAGQAKEWCKDHKVEIMSAIATSITCYGCYLTGRLVERQKTFDVREDNARLEQALHDANSQVQRAYDDGYLDGSSYAELKRYREKFGDK